MHIQCMVSQNRIGEVVQYIAKRELSGTETQRGPKPEVESYLAIGHPKE